MCRFSRTTGTRLASASGNNPTASRAERGSEIEQGRRGGREREIGNREKREKRVGGRKGEKRARDIPRFNSLI